MWYHIHKGKNVFQTRGKHDLRSENIHWNSGIITVQSAWCKVRHRDSQCEEFKWRIHISQVSLEIAYADILKRKWEEKEQYKKQLGGVRSGGTDKTRNNGHYWGQNYRLFLTLHTCVVFDYFLPKTWSTHIFAKNIL